MSDLLDLRHSEPASDGPKAGVLGHLLRSGFAVPPGFVVPASAAPNLAEIGAELHRLARFGTRRVAVRSSATVEDLGGASAAGQYETVLGVTGATSVLAAIHTVRASLHSARAQAYHTRPADAGTMAVLVQSLVEARASGVMFTGEEIRIEATPGLGETLVAGRVTPDLWTVREGIVTERRAGDKALRTGLTDPQVQGLAELGAAVHELLGGPQDIEWAIDTAKRLWILQARPVTAEVPDPAGESHLAPGTLVGLAASAGRAMGPVRLVRNLADFTRVRPGDVLVCPTTDPAWTPLFRIAAAVITERGGLLCHAAIVAREFGIPAVLAVAGATTTLPEGMLVEVDGDAGHVRPSA